MRNKQTENNRGSALVEFSIMLPFITFLLAALIEFGFVLEQYMHLVNVTRDAARQASQVSGLEANQLCVITAGDTSACPGQNSLVPHARAWYLLDELAPAVQRSSIESGSLFIDNASRHRRHQTVNFYVKGEFKSMLNFSIPMQSEATAAYNTLRSGFSYTGKEIEDLRLLLEDDDGNTIPIPGPRP